MVCGQCSAENPEENRFCGACGKELARPSATEAPDEPGAYFCARHPKVKTRLRCSRCEAPICPKCTVYTPAGTRCRDCARNKVPVRPGAVLHEAGRLVESGARYAGQRAWYMAIWYFILSFFRFGDW